MNQDQLRKLCEDLNAYADQTNSAELDEVLLRKLGKPTPVKIWLAASLAKTIQLQLNPPREMQEAVALVAPDWVRG